MKTNLFAQLFSHSQIANILANIFGEFLKIIVTICHRYWIFFISQLILLLLFYYFYLTTYGLEEYVPSDVCSIKLQYDQVHEFNLRVLASLMRLIANMLGSWQLQTLAADLTK